MNDMKTTFGQIKRGHRFYIDGVLFTRINSCIARRYYDNGDCREIVLNVKRVVDFL